MLSNLQKKMDLHHEDVKIPKIIMQTWKGGVETLPEVWKSSPESIKYHMPDWCYVLMTDKDNDSFIEQHFPQYLKQFREFKYGIQRADFIRYAWLYVHGGLYIDCDFELIAPLDDMFLVDKDFYIMKTGSTGWNCTNSLMASKPGVGVWLECMKRSVNPCRWYALGKHLKVMTSTGPAMLTSVVKKQDPRSYHILDSRDLKPCSSCDPKPCQRKGKYVKNLEGASWWAWDSGMYNFFYCRWRLIVVILVVVIISIYTWQCHARSVS